MSTQTEATGRQALVVPGWEWDHPVPLGVRLGNLVVSSIIPPRDPETGHPAKDNSGQVELSFKYMKALIEQAGGTIDDIARVTCLVTDKAEFRPLIDKVWNTMFPADVVGPARLVIEVPRQSATVSIQLEFIAWLGEASA